jgi:alkaline phosphatase
MIRPTRTPILAMLLILALALPIGSMAEDEANASTNGSARCVILMIGDGMGQAQMTSARWDKAEENLTAYQNTSLNMDHMDYEGYVTTYSANSFITDSAAATTAICTARRE